MNRPHIVQILPMYHPDGEDVLNKHAEVKKFTEYNESEICSYLQNNKVDGIILGPRQGLHLPFWTAAIT
ncbi:hypothetical protein E4O93_19710 [Diaphorobacter sp. DS2]|nr:hypothetical protein E4O93_19710 [Diaphorobacter sp. DS2]